MNFRGLATFAPSGAAPWRFDLDFLVDSFVDLDDSDLQRLMDAVVGVYPLSRVTLTRLSKGVTAEIVARCWDRQRHQLNGILALDILDDQSSGQRAEAGEVVRAAGTDRRRSSASLDSPLDEATRSQARRLYTQTQGGSGRLVVNDRSSGDTTFVHTAASIVSRSFVDEAQLQIREISTALREEKSGALVRRYKTSTATTSDTAVTVSSGSGSYPTLRTALSSQQAQPPRHSYSSENHNNNLSNNGNDNVGSFGSGPAVSPWQQQLHSFNSIEFHSLDAAILHTNADRSARSIRLSMFLTDLDSFVPNLTFVFGVARIARCGLVSTHRLRLATDQQTEIFVAKECIHEIGHMFGLHHCVSPCVMAYSTTVEEALEKSNALCDRCAFKVAAMERGKLSAAPSSSSRR